MRKSLLFLAAFMMLAVGCNKDNGPEGDKPSGESNTVSATIADNEASTWFGGESIFLNAGTGAYVYNDDKPSFPVCIPRALVGKESQRGA